MAQQLKLGIIAVMICALHACATVSVYETTKVADISLASDQDKLSRASKSFHKTSGDIGVEDKTSAFDMVASWFGDEEDDSNAYWKRIGADEAIVSKVRDRIALDAEKLTSKAMAVNEAAVALLADDDETTPSRDDVAEMENVLISARNARSSFQEALNKMNKRTTSPVDGNLLLSAFDAEIQVAAQLADKLAAARMSGALSMLKRAST